MTIKFINSLSLLILLAADWRLDSASWVTPFSGSTLLGCYAANFEQLTAAGVGAYAPVGSDATPVV